MATNPILQLLSRRIGLDPGSLGERVIEDCLGEVERHFPGMRMAAIALAAEHDRSVFDTVVGKFVVNESWLFRTPEQFAELQRFARTRARPLQVLSLPAASGEEPASIAVCLAEAGLAPGEFRIVAGDIDVAALQRARSGRFPRSAFRGSTPDPHWFTRHGDMYALAPALLARIEFREINALDADALQDERFDVVFCRNMLIYLHPAARARVLGLLQRVAAPGALVFTGTAEVRVTPATNPRVNEIPLLRPSPPATVRARPATKTAAPARVAHEAPAPTALPLPQQLALIEERADRGELAAACIELDRVLEQSPTSAPAWYLRGVLASAAGDLATAESALDRAAYLDHAHAPTLKLRAELARRRGDHRHAERIAARLKRRRGSEPER
jgi:chemotaxis protein methyltransferase WspC